MRITDALRGEHGVFYAQFDQIHRMLTMEPDLDTIQHEVALLAAGLGSHAHIENQVLFPPLEPTLGGSHGMLAGMRSDHTEIEESLTGIANVRSLHEAVRLILHVLKLARRHFFSEEEELFPSAERILDESALLDLGAVWAERRGVKLTEGAAA